MKSPIAASRPKTSQTILLVLLFAGFVVTGIGTVIVGPILPTFITRFALTDSQASVFFTVQFACSVAGVLASSAVTSSRGYKLPLVLGYLIMGLGFAMLNAGSHAMALIGTAGFGLGYGLVVPGTNLSMAEAGGASLLNLGNFAWGAGAVACSPLIMLSLRRHFLTTFLDVCAAFCFALTIAFLFVRFAHAQPAATAAPESASVPSVKTSGSLTAAIASLFFIYVGVETSLGGWSAAHAARLSHGTTNLATIVPMFFYGGIMTGRALAPWILKRVKEARLIFTALTAIFFGALIVVLATSQAIAILGFCIAGLGCATVYPNYIAWFSRWYGARAKALSALMFSLASVGAAVVPRIVGAVSTLVGSLRIALTIPLAGTVVMICILLALRRRMVF
ncbi:MAG TPA: MFS transporter [Candidatus Acidoferrales bacterium]|nr:MFS transporter [Candidatus Acidoferrales bacterium]